MLFTLIHINADIKIGRGVENTSNKSALESNEI